MQKLAEICIRRPIFAVMLVMALVVVGGASYFRLGVDRFPAVDLPTVMVRTTLPGGSPEDVEAEISDEIEAAVNTVQGITELRSISAQGASVVIATLISRATSTRPPMTCGIACRPCCAGCRWGPTRRWCRRWTTTARR